MGATQQEPIKVRVPVRIDFAGGWTDVRYFAEKEGGAVLNAAIDHYVEGEAQWEGWKLNLSYQLALPTDSHLGTSSAIDVAWLSLTNGMLNRRQSRVELAEASYRLEHLLNVEGGKQDHYAAALGGFNLLRFKHEETPAEVERLEIAPEILRELQERSVLCHSGAPSSSSDIHKDAWERYRQGDEAITRALRRLRDSAVEARDTLMNGKLTALAELLTENRELARQIHADTVTREMDEMFSAAEKAGALGGKACGAGGGGCLYFICAPGQRAQVAEALRQMQAKVMDFSFVPAIAD